MRLIFIILFLPTLLFSHIYPKSKNAFWVVRDALQNQSEIDDIIQTAVYLNISDIFVQVRALGRTYYTSTKELHIDKLGDKFDPLEAIIKRATLYNIRIHAWVNMFYIWSGNQEPEDKNHVYYLLKQKILRNCTFPTYQDLRTAGIEGYFLDPQSSQVKKYLLNLLLEIADKYELAGVHLDYFRYPGVFYSFTPESRTNFWLQNYYDPLELYCFTDEYVQTRGHDVFRYADRVYRQFLIRTLSDYLEEIKEVLKEKKPNLELSVAVKPDPVEAKHRYFQNWLSWIKSNLCDFVVPMNYRTDMKEFTSILNVITNAGVRDKVIVGISTYNQDVQAVNKRILVVQNGGWSGMSLFSYNHLKNNKNYIEKIRPLLRPGDKDGS